MNFIRLFILGLILTFISLPLMAAEFISGDGTILSANDIIEDDLYLFGNNTDLYGKLDGDLAAFCYDIKTEGDIGGNCDIFAYRLDLGGRVEKSIRVFGYQIEIPGSVGRNLIAIGNEIDIEKNAHIGRDVILMGEHVYLDGTILGNATIYAGVVSISGKIGGDVTIKADEINLLAPAVIDGMLEYTSEKEIYIDDDVVIHGEIDWIYPDETAKTEDDSSVFANVFKVIFFLMAFVTGLFFIGVLNKHTRESTRMIEQRFGYTLAIGLLSLMIFTGGALILLVLIVGIPLSLLLVCLGTALFYLGKIYVSIYLGRMIFKLFKIKKAMGWELLIGLIILSLLFQIPVLGVIIYLFAFILGSGAAIAGYQSLCKKEQSVTPQQQ